DVACYPKATKPCDAHPTVVTKVMTSGLCRKPDTRFMLDLTVGDKSIEIKHLKK
ncbi:Hypothetical predicted protein, partial [Marmota monax]